MYLNKKGLSTDDIFNEISDCFGACPILSQSISNLINQIENGLFSLVHKQQPGRPKNPELIENVAKYMNYNPYSSARNCAKVLKISHMTVCSILNNCLNFRLVNASYIPHQLSV